MLLTTSSAQRLRRVLVVAAAVLLWSTIQGLGGAAHAKKGGSGSDAPSGAYLSPAVAPVSNAPATAGIATDGDVPEGVDEPVSGEGAAPKQELDSVFQGTGLSQAELDVGEGFDQLSDPLESFPGILTGSNPPDTVHDVGPDHVVQMVNATFYQIWDKQGISLLGPVTFGSLWPGTSICSGNLGDPIVVYDHLADRWVLSQFASNGRDAQNRPVAPFSHCIAVSQSPDPVNGPDGVSNNGDEWYLYEFDTNDIFPDYPKYGVWPDGYYVSTHESSNSGIWVFDRAAMVSGAAASYFKDTISALTPSAGRNTRILPADLDGPPPAPGVPNFFVRSVDDQQDVANPTDRIEIWEASVDWVAPSFSFTLVDTLTPAAFDIMVCDRNSTGRDDDFRDCIPQPDTEDTLDALSNRPMMQAKFRRFPGDFKIVFNQTIDVSGSIDDLLGFTPADEVAGIRWYELQREPSPGPWSIENEGTYAAQPIGADAEDELLHRWMGSAAMDRAGNIAVGYSIVNDDDDDEVFPSIRYTGRLAGDPNGLMTQGEKTIRAGTTFQGDTDGTIEPRRWGDYSAMTVDPVDDCTFWYTTHLAGSPKPTWIASFKFFDCDATDLAIEKIAAVDVNAGEELFYTIRVTNHGPNDATNVVVTDSLPDGVTFIGDTDNCTETAPNELTCELGDLAADDQAEFVIKVAVAADLVLDNDGAVELVNVAEVSSDQGDPDPANNVAEATTIVQELADLFVAKVCKPDTRRLLAGEEGTCTVVVDNFGPSWARDVVVLDTMVSDGDFVVTSAEILTTGPCNVTPAVGTETTRSMIVCNVGAVEPATVDGEGRAVIQVTMQATEAVDINDLSRVVSTLTPDPDISNNEAQGAISVEAVADLALDKMGPVDAVAGTSFEYELTATNAGPSTAVNVVVEDVVPAGVVIDSVAPQAPCAATCNAGVPGDPFLPTTCDVGTLGNGDSCTIVIGVTVLPDTPAGTILHNDARVSSDTLDVDNSNNLASVDTLVEALADLEVTKSDSPDPVVAGAPLTYEIVVTNGGPSKALGVMLSDDLPDAGVVHFVGTTISGGTGTCALLAGPDQIVECDLNDLDPGAMVTVFIDVVVDPAVPDGAVLGDTVTVTAATPDPDLTNNTATEDTAVIAEADLDIIKDGNFPSGNPSGTIIYKIDVNNLGPSDAQDVTILDTLPADPNKLRFEFVTDGRCSYDEGSHTVSCSIGTLPAGDTYHVEIQVDAKGSLGLITNVAEVSSSTTDPNAANNVAEKDMIVKGGTGDPGGPGGGRGR